MIEYAWRRTIATWRDVDRSRSSSGDSCWLTQPPDRGLLRTRPAAGMQRARGREHPHGLPGCHRGTRTDEAAGPRPTAGPPAIPGCQIFRQCCEQHIPVFITDRRGSSASSRQRSAVSSCRYSLRNSTTRRQRSPSAASASQPARSVSVAGRYAGTPCGALMLTRYSMPPWSGQRSGGREQCAVELECLLLAGHGDLELPAGEWRDHLGN